MIAASDEILICDRWSRILVIACGVTFGWTPLIGAQGLSVPSAHFGALNYPVAEPLFEVGLSFDRFTEHTKHSDSIEAGRTRRVPHYLHRRTDGINLAHGSAVFLWPWSGWLTRVTGFAGVIGEEPSRLLQKLRVVRVGEDHGWLSSTMTPRKHWGRRWQHQR